MRTLFKNIFVISSLFIILIVNSNYAQQKPQWTGWQEIYPEERKIENPNEKKISVSFLFKDGVFFMKVKNEFNENVDGIIEVRYFSSVNKDSVKKSESAFDFEHDTISSEEPFIGTQVIEVKLKNIRFLDREEFAKQKEILRLQVEQEAQIAKQETERLVREKYVKDSTEHANKLIHDKMIKDSIASVQAEEKRKIDEQKKENEKKVDQGKDKKKSTDVTYVQETPQDIERERMRKRQQQADATRKKEEAELAAQVAGTAALMTMDFPSGKYNVFYGSSWYTSINFGLDFVSFPGIINGSMEQVDNYAIQKDYYSTSGNYSGIGAFISAQFYPIYGDHFGLGGNLLGSYGLIPGISHTLTYDWSFKIFFGTKYVKFLCDYESAHRSGYYHHSFTSEYYPNSSFNSVTYQIEQYDDVQFTSNGFGFGIRLGTIDTWYVDAIVQFEHPDYLKGWKITKTDVYKISLNSSNGYGAELSWGFNYPVAGTPKYSFDEEFKACGNFIHAKIIKSFDWYGHPKHRQRTVE